MNNRLKIIRTHLNLSQEEFGSRIGIKSRAHISSLESGSRNITDRIIKDLVSVYNVNEEWLRTGEGDMFLISDSVSLDSHAISCGLSSSDINVIKKFMSIYPSIKDILLDITRNED